MESCCEWRVDTASDAGQTDDAVDELTVTCRSRAGGVPDRGTPPGSLGGVLGTGRVTGGELGLGGVLVGVFGATTAGGVHRPEPRVPSSGLRKPLAVVLRFGGAAASPEMRITSRLVSDDTRTVGLLGPAGGCACAVLLKTASR